MPYIILLTALFLGILLLGTPLTLSYDSREPRLQLTWLGLTFHPGGRGGKPDRGKPSRPRGEHLGALGLLRLLVRERSLFLDLLAKGFRFGPEFIRRLSFKDSRAAVSLPDPMANGLLCALVASYPLPGLRLRVNFQGVNFACIVVTCYPYRVAPPLAGLLLHLPYGRLLRLARKLKRLNT